MLAGHCHAVAYAIHTISALVQVDADWLSVGNKHVICLKIASLMPTHPDAPIHPGKLLPTALLTRRKRSTVRPPRTSVGRSHHWFVPWMGCYIANTPAIRSDLLVASPTIGTSHFQPSWLGCEFATNLQFSMQSTSGYAGPEGA